ncbi:uncharacterized protein LOC142231000 [Haematobia irritans]|uniref:uncharacterized protein LOC142231000 n=1 Tax=Haematobia irritans TaxID=7368 RepID=UPI003F4FE851
MSDISTYISEQRALLNLLAGYEARFDAKEISGRTRGYVNALAQRIDDIFTRFESQHDTIMRLIEESSINVDDVPYICEDVYFNFSEMYFSFKGKLIDSHADPNLAQSPIASTFVAHNGRSDTTMGCDSKLPKISLPKFTGEYMDWLPFRDIYFSLVHQNDSLNKIQKFYYLRSTLGGEAANLIRNISATEANYDSAWKILESRYHNKRMLVGNLISKLFGIPKSSGEFQSIKTLLDSAQECISSLQNLGLDTRTWDPILIHLLVQKLDLQSRRDWEQSLKSSTELPSISELFSFLERTFRTLESMTDEFPSSKQTPTAGTKRNGKSHSQNRRTSCHSGQISKSNSSLCIFCEKTHNIAKCFKFLALPLQKKINFLTSRNACQNCFVVGHDPRSCKSPFRCITCKKQHHTVLHPDESTNGTDTTPGILPVADQVTSHGVQTFHTVLLYTIRLNVMTSRGRFTLRALLDPGSQGSLISESTVQLLGLDKVRSRCRVIGIGEGSENISKYSVELDLYTRKQELVMSCTALVLPNLSSYIPHPSSRNIELPNIHMDNLADPYFYQADSIDLLLGADICSRIKIPTESFVHNDLFFQNTHFGWVFSGPNTSLSFHRIHIHNVNLDNILRSFWEQEEIPSVRKLTSEEVACEQLFEETTTRTESGRYVVKLPFKSILRDGSSPVLNNNVLNAFRRLRHLEISFSKNPLFCESYRKFREYESLGHMTKVGIYPKDVSQNSYFLPHHGVLKENSTTTKLRVVFDGSSHLKDFTKFQQILWRHDPFDEISIYELNTVTYGTSSAPYLAIRVLRQLAQDFGHEFSEAAQILVHDSYVDDIISGSDCLENAIPLYNDLCTLLNKGGCNLRKWITNSKELLHKIPEGHRESSVTLNFDRDNVVRTLGIEWNTNSDTFSFKVNLDENPIISKRKILSESARLYDPLGWLTPTTVVAKSLFKELWERGIDWDDKVPQDIEDRWLRHRHSLSKLSDLSIPRWLQWCRTSQTELHCFCDASTTAYAAVVYIRITTINDIFINMLQAKSKVSPIKTVSIPRLELCAAVLGAKLTQKIKESLVDLNVDGIFYWSDSSTVLSWVRKTPSNWTVYVANRVADLQRMTNPIQWRYVPSALNPADCASRGVLAEELIENQVWWYGPSFLYKSKSSWPENLPNLNTSEEKRCARVCVNSASRKSYPEILTRFSKLHTLLRVIALCLRFCHNCKDSRHRVTGSLSVGDVNRAMRILVKLSQEIDFPEEMSRLSSDQIITYSPILKLMPFLDDNGIIRVGGRLHDSNYPYDLKHPCILAKSNPLSTLIILDAHENTLHGGVTLTMSYVNRKFWIVSGNVLAKRIIHKCMTCFRYMARTSKQIMGNLPRAGLNITRPFRHSGVDYAGPISIKMSSLRSAVVSKGYICLFVCMVTKAIHLEAVSNLTTSAFLAAFKRFVSRRGQCSDLYSDCGTNFVGASKELQVLHNENQKSLPEELRHALNLKCTTWHFIPPASPNFGGLWEAGVKSVKFHLKRLINDRILNFEELGTLLCQIESCLNSRPLCPLSPDPSSFEALTPAHFLLGEPTTCLQDECLLDTKPDLLSRWKTVEKLKQHFWKRWRNEYLNRLQARPKWLKSENEPKIGDLVLVVDDRCGPGQWLLGRVENIHPGPDGLIRVVSVLLKNKIIKRPISKICLLPENTAQNDIKSSNTETSNLQ